MSRCEPELVIPSLSVWINRKQKAAELQSICSFKHQIYSHWNRTNRLTWHRFKNQSAFTKQQFDPFKKKKRKTKVALKWIKSNGWVKTKKRKAEHKGSSLSTVVDIISSSQCPFRLQPTYSRDPPHADRRVHTSTNLGWALCAVLPLDHHSCSKRAWNFLTASKNGSVKIREVTMQIKTSHIHWNASYLKTFVLDDAFIYISFKSMRFSPWV